MTCWEIAKLLVNISNALFCSQTGKKNSFYIKLNFRKHKKEKIWFEKYELVN